MQDLGKRYTLLTRLPLLQGISSTELLGWEDVLRLDADELPASRMPLIRQGDNCSALIYLVEGEMKREHRSANKTYVACSRLKAPAAIEADRLFGLNPTYQHTYFAQTDVTMLNIRKSQVSNQMMKSEVFRLNLLNMLSAQAQKRATALIPRQMNSAEERFRHLIRTLFPDCEGEVELHIHMKELARYIGESRLTVSHLLNGWDEAGMLRLGRGHFTIPDIQDFLSDNRPTLNNNTDNEHTT